MNRTLRRPMFRIGGVAEGITSGLQPRQGYADPAGKVSQAPRRNTGISDFLINMGLDLVSRPKGGNIFQQVATSAKGPFKEFQAARAAGEERDWKMGLHREKMGLEERKIDIQEKQFGEEMELTKYLGEIEAKGKKQWIIEELDKHWDTKIAAAEAEGKSEEDIAELESLKAEDRYKALHGYDVSDQMAILRNTAAFEKAEELARGELQATINPETEVYWARTDKGFAEAVIELTNKYLRQIANFLTEEERALEATGGRVGYQNAGAVMPGQPMQAQAPGPTDQGTEMPQELSGITFEELRARLPQEVGDDIVRLLANSSEALEDFATIQTEQDIANFNKKYGVNLVLPSGG